MEWKHRAIKKDESNISRDVDGRGCENAPFLRGSQVGVLESPQSAVRGDRRDSVRKFRGTRCWPRRKRKRIRRSTPVNELGRVGVEVSIRIVATSLGVSVEAGL